MPRRLLVGLLSALLAIAIAACARVATDEPGDANGTNRYDTFVSQGGNASYLVSGDRGYDGSSNSRKAVYNGAPPPAQPSSAYGEFNNLTPANNEGTYAAALYFPLGTLNTYNGVPPAQKGAVDVMRWERGNQFGGIRIGTDHKGHLIRGQSGGGQPETIGDSLMLREGCWNWLVVTQKVSSGAPGAAMPNNQVFLNGRELVDSHKPNTYADLPDSGRVRFGLPWFDEAAQSTKGPLEFYVDNATISSVDTIAPSTAAGTCTPRPPNILFIVTDDQRADDTMHQMPFTVKWFRNGESPPNDDVKEGGTEFFEGYATTPLCCPARSSILTGKYAHNHGVRDNDESSALTPDEQLQSLLQGAPIPYLTGIAGKYLNDWNLYLDPPNFDKFWIMRGGYTPTVNNNGFIESLNPNFPYPPTQPYDYSTTYFKDKALEFLDYAESTQDSKPWFLYLAPYASHEEGSYPYANMDDPDLPPPGQDDPPLPGPPNYPSRNETDLSDKPEWVRQWSDQANIFRPGDTANGGPLRNQMLRSLRAADNMVEAVMQHMKDLGEERDTLAVFIGDNGYMWREHGTATNEQAVGSCTTAGTECGVVAKVKPYTESVKVPFFMRWPANPAVQRVVTDQSNHVGNIDLAPTAMSAAGLGSSTDASQMDGISLVGGSRTEILTEAWANGGPRTWASLRGWDSTHTRHFHYIEYYEPDGRTLRQEDDLCTQAFDPQPLREYYDLTIDPYELTNLFRDCNSATPDPTFANELQTRLLKTRWCAGRNDCTPGALTRTGDPKDPKVWIKTPAQDDIVNGNPTNHNGYVLFAADASDNIGVKKITLKQGSTELTANPNRPCCETTIDTTGMAQDSTITLTAIAEDYAGRTDTAQVTVRVKDWDVQAMNKTGGTPGRIEIDDKIHFYFNRVIQPEDIVSGWGGSSRPENVQVNPDDPAFGYNDTLSLPGVPKLGTVNLGQAEYWRWRYGDVDAPAIFPAAFPDSAMVMDADQRGITVTLSASSQPQTTAPLNTGTMVWSPGSICSVQPCRATESVPVAAPAPGSTADKDF